MFDLKANLRMIAIGIAILAAFVLMLQHATINGLRTKLAVANNAHDITRASLTTARAEIDRQNSEIERQRAAQEQAKRDLAQANEASQGSQEMIDKLIASSRAPAGDRCEPSAAVRGVWK